MSLHRLSSVSLAVPNIEQSTAFFTEFGLVRDAGQGTAFTTRDGGRQLELTSAKTRGINAISVGADDVDDLGRIAVRLTAQSIAHELTATSLRVVEPATGINVHVAVEARHKAAVATPLPGVNRPGHVARTNRPAAAVTASDRVRPAALSHVVIGSPDQPGTLRFFTETLGFEISDQLEGIIAFTRCSESHHNVAIQLAPCPMVHHVAFEVDSIDDVARGGSELIRADETRQLWGLGRHAIGSNWFWYLREPNGHFVEYTADIDRITSQDLYEPKEWAGHEFLYSMGQPPPVQFLEPDDMSELIAAHA
jgi:catechol 2,3-dioxygenase-like lactoylglutathione lyase family enzyme